MTDPGGTGPGPLPVAVPSRWVIGGAETARTGVVLLVLTRKPNQRINIGDDIVVTVLEVRGDQVRLGIEAPRDVGVQREEIYVQLRTEDGERRAG